MSYVAISVPSAFPSFETRTIERGGTKDKINKGITLHYYYNKREDTKDLSEVLVMRHNWVRTALAPIYRTPTVFGHDDYDSVQGRTESQRQRRTAVEYLVAKREAARPIIVAFALKDPTGIILAYAFPSVGHLAWDGEKWLHPD